MSTVLAYVEHDHDGVGETGLELVTEGHRIAGALGTSLTAVLVGPGADQAAAGLGAYGAAGVRVVTHDAVSAYAPAAYGESIAQLVAELSPVAVLSSGTEKGNEVLAHVAARTDLPMAANCTEVTAAADAPWTLTRQRWGGSLLEDAELDADVKLLTLSPHAFAAAEVNGSGQIPVEPFSPTLDDATTAIRVVDHEASGGGISLATAPVVVSGGRGVGSAEGFDVLEQLAGLLDGAVGCSRVATNNGWRSHSDQVGQTGTRIAPQLYMACGISGATQHWVGCKDAKTILSINTDPEAPMVTRGHYAVIGDLGAVLPAIVEEVRRRQGA